MTFGVGGQEWRTICEASGNKMLRPLISPTTTPTAVKNSKGFTRLELVAVIAGLALLCMVALPLYAATRGDSERAACLNNLRQLGRAVQMWGGGPSR